MGGCPSRSAVACLIVLSCVAGGCSTSQPKSETSSIVALGDSVPRGTNCDCRPYPPLTADGLMESSGKTVTATLLDPNAAGHQQIAKAAETVIEKSAHV
jgi:hypothetical protein